MSIELKHIATHDAVFDEHEVWWDATDTGCKLCFGDLHGPSYFLYFPCGDYVRLNSDMEDCKKVLETDWQGCEQVLLDDLGCERGELYEEAEEGCE